ncbi:SDR family NAD(P)-dependent oxidoreductase [Natronococcus roseus]|uniref:SDR family NAD(P)-dependent oxidoreductase n=1 Tax=Natronococcus roseus TaxID=1052014 RepID=UPI00374C9B15
MGTVSFDFQNETVIVTGGSSGIGRAIALRFGRAGATVINADIRSDPKDKDETQPTHQKIKNEGGTAEFVETDVSEPDELRNVIGQAREYDSVDIMVNNAGWFTRAPFLDVDSSEFRKIHEINTAGVFFGCQVAAQEMIKHGSGGSIINTASISSTHAQTDQAPYDSTKAAIQMLTKNAALEFADHGIRVNAIAPGHIATEFGSGAEKKEESVEAGDLTKSIPLNRPGYPEDLDGTVLFLASDNAEYITGETVYIDGGWQTY